MKRYRFTFGLVVSLLLIGPSTNVEASTTGSTQAIVDFQSLGVPVILDPNNPEVPLTPKPNTNDGDVNNVAGELTLDFAPNMYFGTNQIRESNQLKYLAKTTAKNGTLSRGPFLQVTDRRVTSTGWTVSLQASSFYRDGVTTTVSLPGAYFTFENGVVTKPSAQPGVGPALRSANIRVNTDNVAVPIMTAQVGDGQRTWLAHWIDNNAGDGIDRGVYLNVTANTMQAGEHASLLTWTLAPNLGN